MTWLASPACRDADRDLAPPYRTVRVPEDRLASPETVRRGGALFRQYCAICHGARGDGHGLQSEGLNPAPRDLTDPVWRQSTTPRHVFFAIREGMRGTAMPSWKALSEDDAWSLTAYVLSLGAPEAGRGGG